VWVIADHRAALTRAGSAMKVEGVGSRLIARRKVLRLTGESAQERQDALAVEEPLELRVEGRPLTTTMRTPGADFDLAAGFLVSEGAVRRQADVIAMRYCSGTDAEGRNTYNVLDLQLAVPAPEPRAFLTTSACGVCGSESVDAARRLSPYRVEEDATQLERGLLGGLPARLRAGQELFERTGGLHAAGLFTADGELVCLREDVGRHNAVDKVVGWALREDRLPLSGHVLVVSGRASFELVQKAWLAGIPVLAAVSAPSSLAVELAAAAGMTLAGFVRGDSMNVYTGRQRVL
jgi:FdhD protein